MHEQHPTEAAPRTPGANPRRKAASPSSSRMIASYLTDIEQMLDEHRWDAALREASDLPRIAVALADPGLRSPGEQVKDWCRQWVRLPPARRQATDTDTERLARGVTERAVPGAEREPIPTRALRRLQLRRHVRTPQRGFAAKRGEGVPEAATETEQLGAALVEATRRWYARSGVHDATVQGNLARLAVLR